MRFRMLALAAGLWLTGFSMEDVPFEVLKGRPRRQSARAQYEVERSGEAVIVTIHAGSQPTGGYSVEVRRVVKEGSKCVVHYAVIEPPPDAMVPQVITYPAAMVRIQTACKDVEVQPPLPRAAAAGQER
jgi:hypothetical protein